MGTDSQIIGIETRLNQKGAWQDVLLISTSLFMYGLSHAVPIPIEREANSRNRKSFNQMNTEVCSFSSGTTLSESPYSFINITTATRMFEENFSDDYIVKAPVVREFRILIPSLKIDRSLPKLFAE